MNSLTTAKKIIRRATDAFLPPGGQIVRPSEVAQRFGRRLLDQATPAIVTAKLSAMAVALRFKSSLRCHLADVHPIAGAHDFRATIEFVTLNGDAAVHATFGAGEMSVHAGGASGADLTVRFRDRENMRAFFAGKDTLDMLVDNTLTFEGNLSCLLKFGHMSMSVRLQDRRLTPETAWARGPSSWKLLTAPPAGEPAETRPEGEVVHLGDPHFADLGCFLHQVLLSLTSQRHQTHT